MGIVLKLPTGRKTLPSCWKKSYLWRKAYEYFLPQFERIEELRNRDRFLPLPPFFYAQDQAERMAERVLNRIQRRGRIDACYRACIEGIKW